MRALLLAAGLGTRLGNITKTTPKCLLKFGKGTMLDHWLNKLDALGVEEFIINTHYLANQVNEFVSTHKFRKKIKLSFEKKLLGTAGTILKHSYALNKGDSFIVHVDNYCEDPLNSFLEAHQKRPIGTELSMLTFTTSSPESCGVVETNKDGRLTAFFEKHALAPSCRANGAVYLATPEFFMSMNKLDGIPSDFSRDIIPQLLNKIYCIDTHQFFEDIGTVETLVKTRTWLSKRDLLSISKEKNDENTCLFL